MIMPNTISSSCLLEYKNVGRYKDATLHFNKKSSIHFNCVVADGRGAVLGFDCPYIFVFVFIFRSYFPLRSILSAYVKIVKEYDVIRRDEKSIIFVNVLF